MTRERCSLAVAALTFCVPTLMISLVMMRLSVILYLRQLLSKKTGYKMTEVRVASVSKFKYVIATLMNLSADLWSSLGAA